MQTNYGPYYAFESMYDTGGHSTDPSAEGAVLAGMTKNPDGKVVTDLIVMSHGWNNNIDEARSLYQDFFQSLASVCGNGFIAGRNPLVVGIFWPSMRFTDAQLIPGGAASLGDQLDAQLNAQLDAFQVLFGADPTAKAKIDHARAQIPKLELSQSAQNDFVFTLKSLVPLPRGPADEGLDEARRSLDAAGVDGSTILARLGQPIGPTLPTPGTLATGGAASIGSVFSSVKNAASNFLNVMTYYTMKDRAGIVGSTGVASLLSRILQSSAADPNYRVHLIGHSFGGRLVTAAANAQATGAPVIHSMNLLQAAYSHYGLAKKWNGTDDGAFRSIVDDRKVANIMITHSVHDLAVGLAYPMASRLMGQVAAAIIGGPTDIYGGMGRNGAQSPQSTQEAYFDKLLPVGGSYQALPAGKSIRNVNGDGPSPSIDSHGDVRKPEVAHAVRDTMI